MKNIHILPTNKPSRVFNTNKGEYHFREHYVPDTIQTCKNHNIYITSDEEISRDTKPCWCLDDKDNSVNYYQGALPLHNYIGYKKIILTTEQDLIADGVQAIDNKFLEWFVKNPTCEEVEIQCRYNFYIGQNLTHYKVIIPKEEPKQETLEETAKKYANEWEEIHGLNWDNLNLTPEQISQLDFKSGAKWQEKKAKETQKLTMINALVEFSKAHFDIHTEEAISYITKKAEKYYNKHFKQQEQ